MDGYDQLAIDGVNGVPPGADLAKLVSSSGWTLGTLHLLMTSRYEWRRWGFVVASS